LVSTFPELLWLEHRDGRLSWAVASGCIEREKLRFRRALGKDMGPNTHDADGPVLATLPHGWLKEGSSLIL